MNDDDSNPSQLRFEDGNLVEPSPDGEAADDGRAAEPIEPSDRTGFVVDAKSGAVDVNSALAEAVETHGRTLDFGSRSHAEDYARQLSAADGSLRVQAAPENEPRDVDAYLLADHDPSITEPACADGDTWTFDVGANLYGALGEAILLSNPKPHALVYFVRQDLGLAEDELERGLNLVVDAGGPVAVDHPEGRKRWTPDCTVDARDGWRGRVLETYYCEVKTGDASFERAQVETMEALAADERVLKIRVDIRDLPDQYSLRIQEVSHE